jgi:type IV secretory pathway TraG/TraD family ATPase VirD4
MEALPPNLLGTAEWMAPSELSAKFPYEDGKFWLGRCPASGAPLGYVDDRHICLVSGNRAGKGTTSIINNLCLWPGSVVVIDPKGENATVTAERRGNGNDHCKGMGQAVHVLDPFAVASIPDHLRSRYNPLDALDANDPRSIDDAGRLADAIVVQTEHSSDPFWEQSARALIKGLILHVLTDSAYEGRRNLGTIRDLITRGDQASVESLRALNIEDIPSGHSLLWEGVAANGHFGGVIAGVGETFANMAEQSPKQFQSVLQVANRNTEFLDSPGMRQCVESSDFRLEELKTNARGMSLYLSLPQRYMGEHFRWLRMMITLIIGEMEAVQGKPASGHRVLMVLDEFAGLKRMEVIENAVSQVAGYGLTLFFVLQSLVQLKEVYQDGWETFMTNAALRLFSGIDDDFTREYIVKQVGETEVIRDLDAYAENFGWSFQKSTNTSSSKQTSQSATTSESWGSFTNRGTSSGGSTTDSWESWPLFLRNTAGLFAGIVGGRGSSRSTNWGSTAGGGENEGGSIATTGGESTSETTGDGETDGTSGSETWTRSQSLHKRPLITGDEIGRYFARIDDNNDPFFPGCMLALVSGRHPSVIQKTAYFDDRQFSRSFTPHPDHRPLTTTRALEPHGWVNFTAQKVPGKPPSADMWHHLMGPEHSWIEWKVKHGSEVRVKDFIAYWHFKAYLEPFGRSSEWAEFCVALTASAAGKLHHNRDIYLDPNAPPETLTKIPASLMPGVPFAYIEPVPGLHESEVGGRGFRNALYSETSLSSVVDKIVQAASERCPARQTVPFITDDNLINYGFSKKEIESGTARFRLAVSIGDRVQAGQTIATIQSRKQGTLCVYAPITSVITGVRDSDGKFLVQTRNGVEDIQQIFADCYERFGIKPLTSSGVPQIRNLYSHRSWSRFGSGNGDLIECTAIDGSAGNPIDPYKDFTWKVPSRLGRMLQG